MQCIVDFENEDENNGNESILDRKAGKIWIGSYRELI